MENRDWDQRYRDADTPWDSGVPSKVLTEAIESGLIKPCRALELGCGTGTNAIFLAKSGFEVTAVDLSSVAIEQARRKAEEAGISINFMQADVSALPYDGPPFQLVFDRGTYHIVRSENLLGLQKTLAKVVAPGGYYLVLAGNANENAPPDRGPPRVTAHELTSELEFDQFDLVSLEESHFNGIRIGSEILTPLAWKAILRRRASAR